MRSIHLLRRLGCYKNIYIRLLRQIARKRLNIKALASERQNITAKLLLI